MGKVRDGRPGADEVDKQECHCPALEAGVGAVVRVLSCLRVAHGWMQTLSVEGCWQGGTPAGPCQDVSGN